MSAPPPIFSLVQRVGSVSQPDIEATLNQGVGMVMLLPEESVALAQSTLSAHGIASWVAGRATAVDAGGGVELHGSHPG